MTCGNCARHVSEAAQTVPGVATSEARPAEGSLIVWWSPGTTPNPQGVAQAVTAAGYPTSVLAAEPGPAAPSSPAGAWLRTLQLGGLCTLVLFALDQRVHHAHATGVAISLWPSFLVSTLAMAGCGLRFARGAWNQARASSFGMDALVTLGSAAAYGYSTAAWVTGGTGHLYFMEAAAILTFISAGHWMEARVGARAESALHALLRLAPATARRRTASGGEEEVPIGRLQPGDEVILRPGDRVPTDGKVVAGKSAVDESMLTGESGPVAKGPDSDLYGGTSLLDGTLAMRVTSLGEATALARIILAVRRAQASRANIQRLADKISSVFVPGVIGVALATLLGWGLAPAWAGALHSAAAVWIPWGAAGAGSPWADAWIHAAAVLIVACPCAMGLATPAAIMAAANAAARRGILIRDGVALERAGKITHVLFDKTGTLTLGQPSVVGFLPEGAGRLKELAAALGRPSRHPASRAAAGLSGEPVPLLEWQEVRGEGVRARLGAAWGEIPEGTEVRLGSPAWIGGAGEPENFRSTGERGATRLLLSVAGRPVAMLLIRDAVRSEAAEVIGGLRASGRGVAMVTGDTLEAAAAIGERLGFQPSEIHAGVRPEQKSELLKELQAAGQRVAFVGDGINDAPALAQSDLGIAVPHASDIARETADLVLLRASLRAVPESLELAGSALRIIRQNLFWAFFYNTLAVPLAALGFMNPMLCAVTMGLSDVLVIGNSLRLLRSPRSS